MLKRKIVAHKQNDLNRLIIRFNMVKERISELEDGSIDIIQCKLPRLIHKEKNKSERHKTQDPKAVGQYQSKLNVTEILEGREAEEIHEETVAEEIHEEKVDENFPTMMEDIKHRSKPRSTPNQADSILPKTALQKKSAHV